MNIFDQLDELERDVDLALDEERDRVGFAHSKPLRPLMGADPTGAKVAVGSRGDSAGSLPLPTAPGNGFCPSCGYRWDLHDNRNVLNKSPFGCPSETVARLEWGR